MPVLVCYDISNNSLRSRIGNKLLENGLDRINKSVYLERQHYLDTDELSGQKSTLIL